MPISFPPNDFIPVGTPGALPPLGPHRAESLAGRLLPPPPTIEAMRERLGLSAPAFEAELSQLAAMPVTSRAYRELAQSILDRAPSVERLAEVQALALFLGRSRAERRALDLARLALLPSGSEAASRLHGQLVAEKVSHDVAVDVLERDEEAADEFRTWLLQQEELYR